MAKAKSKPAARGLLLTSVGVILFWMPVWIPLCLLAQIALRGLNPSLVEHERLLREEQTVTERHEAARAQFQSMQAEATAWKDPVYHERVRRVRAADEEAQSH